jgi:hypothetical protein
MESNVGSKSRSYCLSNSRVPGFQALVTMPSFPSDSQKFSKLRIHTGQNFSPLRTQRRKRALLRVTPKKHSNMFHARHQWLTPVILATQEVAIRQIVHETLS